MKNKKEVRKRREITEFKIEIEGDYINCPLTGAEKLIVKESIKRRLKNLGCKTKRISIYP